MRKLAFILLFVFLYAMAQAPASQAAAAAEPDVSAAWIRHVPGQPNAAAYFTVTAPTGDALTAVHAACCRTLEMHEMTMQGDVMHMRPVARVALPKNAPVNFAPLGYHVMLLGLKQDPAVGSRLPITLEFASGARKTVDFTVRPLGDTPAAEQH